MITKTTADQDWADAKAKYTVTFWLNGLAAFVAVAGAGVCASTQNVFGVVAFVAALVLSLRNLSENEARRERAFQSYLSRKYGRRR